MARELVRKTLDGHTYEFQQLGAKQSLKLLTRLLKILGEPLTLGISALGIGKEKAKNLLDREINGDLLGKAVRALCEKLDEDIVVDLVEQLSSQGVLCDGKQIIFHTHYEGRLGHLFKVLGTALEVQYGDFFAVLKDQKESLGMGISPVQPT